MSRPSGETEARKRDLPKAPSHGDGDQALQCWGSMSRWQGWGFSQAQTPEQLGRSCSGTGEAGSGSCATAGSACAAAVCLDGRMAARRPAMRHRVERVIAPGVSEPTRFLVMKEPLGGTRCAGGPGTQSSQTGRASSCLGHSPRSRRWEPPAHPWGAPKRGWDRGESASQSSCPFPDPPHCRAGDAAVQRQWDSTGEMGDLPPSQTSGSPGLPKPAGRSSGDG